MSKNTLIDHKLVSKTNIALFCVIGMMSGFLVSRVVLSISMFLLGVTGLWGVHPRRWFKERFWLIGIGWVCMYAISYFWSDNIPFWGDRLQVKLPFLILPLAFAFLPGFSLKQLRIFTVCVAFVLLGGVAYSLSFYLKDPGSFLAEYKVSHVIPTPAKNDHIRFSLTIALFTIWCVGFWPHLVSRAIKWFIGIIIAIFSIYIHILAAKSGLLVWYFSAAAFCSYLIYKKQSRIIGISVTTGMIVATFLAISFIPTLKERIGYMHYTYNVYNQGNVSGDYGDIGRIVSYDIALKEIKEHPVIGVGAGDILDAMKQGYDKWYPQIKDEQRLVPHNEFMTVALGCGIPTAILFLIWVLAPLSLVKRGRQSFFFFITWMGLLLSLMVEPMLEVQFGVFVYLFFLLWQRHTLLHELQLQKQAI
ncbi:MAG: O-antigen ligase family protein [Bacteroidota bacterium]